LGSLKSSGNQLISDQSSIFSKSSNLFETKVFKNHVGTREYLASELITGGMLEFFMEGTRSRPVNLLYPRSLKNIPSDGGDNKIL
jgi:hypothetical protein